MSNFGARRSFFQFIFALSLTINLGLAFIVPSTTYYPTLQRHNENNVFTLNPRATGSVSLFAKKKRRRRKQSTKPSPSQSNKQQESLPQQESANSNELPDFDLDADVEVEAPVKKNNQDLNEITANMMARGNAATQTLDELIADRSIESRISFQDNVEMDSDIPDFAEIARLSPSSRAEFLDNPSGTTGRLEFLDDSPGAGMGKKKQRQAERIAKAVAAKEAEERDFLSFFPPQVKNEKGEFSPIKLLEQGAWAGIFLLVAWEVYLSSPFFERAAPMAPIVYEILM